MLKELLEYSGVEPERLNFTWCSAAEGRRFASVVRQVVERVKSVGPWDGYLAADLLEGYELEAGNPGTTEPDDEGGVIDDQFL